MGLKLLVKLEKSRVLIGSMRLWMIRAFTTVFLWVCIFQFVVFGELSAPKLFKNWPSCFNQQQHRQQVLPHDHLSSIPPKFVSPPKRVYKNNGYLMVSCNGGLNQMRAAICDMVAIARLLNVTLIVQELDKNSFWADPSEFQDIFDVDHFVTSLRDQVRVLKELPPRLKRRVKLGMFYSLPPVSWSNISYYLNQILPLIKLYKVVHLNKTDARLANNGVPVHLQKLRCRATFKDSLL